MSRNSKSQHWQRLLALAEREVAQVLRSVPPHLCAAAQAVTLVYESCPNAALVKDGIESDTLGLFVGEPFAESDHGLCPPEIMLFLENLWDVAEEDDEFFCEEVRATFLHELGHYLGLDEDDLTERGLE
jgi:predicted Zn-dependent protease with MMP-like domain